MRGYWPLQTDDTTGITDYLNDVSKYLLSNTLQDPEWERRVVLRSVDDIRALKSETGGEIVTTGNIRLVCELIAAGLVDEYRLSPIQSCSGAANGCSRTRPRSRACAWCRASPSAPASCSCATGQPDGASASRSTDSASMPPERHRCGVATRLLARQARRVSVVRGSARSAATPLRA